MKKLILLGALSVLFYAVPGYTSVFGPFGDLVSEMSGAMKDAAKKKFQETKDKIMSNEKLKGGLESAALKGGSKIMSSLFGND